VVRRGANQLHTAVAVVGRTSTLEAGWHSVPHAQAGQTGGEACSTPVRPGQCWLSADVLHLSTGSPHRLVTGRWEDRGFGLCVTDGSSSARHFKRTAAGEGVFSVRAASSGPTGAWGTGRSARSDSLAVRGVVAQVELKDGPVCRADAVCFEEFEQASERSGGQKTQRPADLGDAADVRCDV